MTSVPETKLASLQALQLLLRSNKPGKEQQSAKAQCCVK